MMISVELRTGLVAVLTLILTLGVNAQKSANPIEDTYRGPSLALVREILAEGEKKDLSREPAKVTPPAPSDKKLSAVKFKPAGDSGVSRSIAEALGQNPQQIATLKETFEDMKKAFEAEVGPQGKANDLAAALTFFLATNVMVYHDAAETSDAASEEMYGGIEKLINSSPQFVSVSDKEKQQLYDWLLYMAGFALANYQDNKRTGDAAGLKNIREFANLSTKVILGKGLDDGANILSKPSTTPMASGTNSTGITARKTTFSDGWTAMIESDAVHLTKGQLDVYLYWPIEFTDEIRSRDTADYMWNTVVVPRFSIRSAQKFEDSVPDFLERLYYYEGTGTQKAGGKSGYIAMKAVSQTGFSKVIVALAPDKAAYKAALSEPKALSALLGANRFAITASDLVGTWKNFDGTNLMFYNSNSGQYAGSSTVAVSDEFTFTANGSYTSDHAQGSTQFGVTKGGRQHYAGRAIASAWEVTLTNRYDGRTEIFNAYFEAVRNGRILHLTKKDATGIQFHLVKVK